MADEDPSETTPAADSSLPKKETVRITLPPKPEDTPMVKRETVRINAPGVAPKKETTSIGAATPLPSAEASPVPPPPSATRPLVPPPAPRPPSAPGLPAAARPGMPPVAPKPAAPAAPAPAPKPAAAYGAATPTPIKAAPKKETARIQVAPTQKLPPQATVKLSQPSQQLSAAPAQSLRSAPAPAAAVDTGGGEDKVVTMLSWAAVVISIGAAVLGYLAWSA